MKAILFTAHSYERAAFDAAQKQLGCAHRLTYVRAALDASTVDLANGHEAIIPFVNDQLVDEALLRQVAACGVRLIALRSAGHNNLDVAAARRLGLTAAYVPAYTPHAVAEYVFALALALTRHIPRAVSRVRDGNFSIEGLVGTVLHRRTFGVVGLGKIGEVVATIAEGFGCKVVVSDPYVDPKSIRWPVLSVDDLLAQSHVVSLHAPLTPATRGLIDARRLALLQDGAILINTSRGPLLDTAALIDELRRDRLGGVALDVYDQEAGVFFTDHSGGVLHDDALARLLTFPKVIVTSHMGFMTAEALQEIATTTLENLTAFEAGRPLANELK